MPWLMCDGGLVSPGMTYCCAPLGVYVLVVCAVRQAEVSFCLVSLMEAGMVC